MSAYARGLVLTTLSAIAWSTAGFFTTLIPLDNWSLLVWRGLFGAGGILVVMAFMRRGRLRADFRALGLPGWLLAITSGAGMVCFITALTRTSVAHVAVIYGTAPFIVAGLGWWILRERPARPALAAALAALAGVSVMVLPGMTDSAGLLGDLLALGMTVAVALMMIVAKRFPGIPMLAAAALSALLSALVAVPFLEPVSYPPLVWMELAAFGLVNSALGLALFILGSRLLPAIETALIGALDAPLAPIWVWLAFGIFPDDDTLLGGLIVFAAVAAHILGQRQRVLC